MTKHELTTLALRLLGIYCFIAALPLTREFFVVFTWPWHTQTEDLSRTYLFLTAVFPCASLIVGGVVLLGFSQALGRRLTPGNPDQLVLETWSMQTMQAVLFAVVGVLILARVVPTGFRHVAHLVYLNNQGFTSDWLTTSNTWIGLAATTVELLIGIYLFFGAHSLSNAWRRLRTAGTDKPAVS